jgi:hypothetical protein
MELYRIFIFIMKTDITVHRFRVQRSGLRIKKALNTRSDL